MWNVLRMYEIGGSLLSGVKLFYIDANACVKVNEEVDENF